MLENSLHRVSGEGDGQNVPPGNVQVTFVKQFGGYLVSADGCAPDAVQTKGYNGALKGVASGRAPTQCWDLSPRSIGDVADYKPEIAAALVGNGFATYL